MGLHRCPLTGLPLAKCPVDPERARAIPAERAFSIRRLPPERSSWPRQDLGDFNRQKTEDLGNDRAWIMCMVTSRLVARERTRAKRGREPVAAVRSLPHSCRL